MKPNRSTLAFLVTLILAAALVWWVIARVDEQTAEGTDRSGWQHADTPPFTATPEDPWLALPDAWTETASPVATDIGPAMRAGADTEVFAVADGIVLFSGIRDGVHAVMVGHRNASGARFESIYTPLRETTRKTGELVGRGTLIGRSGGQSLGPVFRETPADIDPAQSEKSPLAMALESPESETWMSLEISNAEKMLELMEDAED